MHRLTTLLPKCVTAFLILASTEFARAQTLQTLHSFTTGDTNGGYPSAALTLGSEGNFYGTTSRGGSNDSGSVFKVTINGTLTTLYSFSGGSDGAHPHAALTLGIDGTFYGTTYDGGITNTTFAQGMGTIFRVTSNGILTTLYSFTGGSNALHPD